VLCNLGQHDKALKVIDDIWHENKDIRSIALSKIAEFLYDKG